MGYPVDETLMQIVRRNSFKNCNVRPGDVRNAKVGPHGHITGLHYRPWVKKLISLKGVLNLAYKDQVSSQGGGD